MNFFNELKASLIEAINIKNGTKVASKITIYEADDVIFSKKSFETLSRNNPAQLEKNRDEQA